MKVYRLEHKTLHKGPYALCWKDPDTDAAIELLNDVQEYSFMSGHQRAPMPHNDQINESYEYMTRFHIFGFDSLNQLHNWFNELELDLLINHANYHIVEYVVDKEYILHFRHQICFHSLYAIKQQTI